MTNPWIPHGKKKANILGRSFLFEKEKPLGGYVEEIDKIDHLSYKENKKL